MSAEYPLIIYKCGSVIILSFFREVIGDRVCVLTTRGQLRARHGSEMQHLGGMTSGKAESPALVRWASHTLPHTLLSSLLSLSWHYAIRTRYANIRMLCEDGILSRDLVVKLKRRQRSVWKQNQHNSLGAYLWSGINHSPAEIRIQFRLTAWREFILSVFLADPSYWTAWRFDPWSLQLLWVCSGFHHGCSWKSWFFTGRETVFFF